VDALVGNGKRRKGGCTCHVCGKKYHVDLNVSDEIWKRIRPDKSRPVSAGLMCGECVMAAIEQEGNYGAYTLVANKDVCGERSEPVERSG